MGNAFESKNARQGRTVSFVRATCHARRRYYDNVNRVVNKIAELACNCRDRREREGVSLTIVCFSNAR